MKWKPYFVSNVRERCGGARDRDHAQGALVGGGTRKAELQARAKTGWTLHRGGRPRREDSRLGGRSFGPSPVLAWIARHGPRHGFPDPLGGGFDVAVREMGIAQCHLHV